MHMPTQAVVCSHTHAVTTQLHLILARYET